jgi:hypothetical protein
MLVLNKMPVRLGSDEHVMKARLKARAVPTNKLMLKQTGATQSTASIWHVS